MSFDLVIVNVNLPPFEQPVDIGVRQGLVAELAPAISAEGPRFDGGGALAFGGFVESHIHLDKAMILDRCAVCEGTLAEAVALTARAKAAFTEEDVYRRAATVLERAILHGTNRMRSFVEVDPRAGLRSFAALQRVAIDYAYAIDLELCAFAQEGLTNEPETHRLLVQALESGARSLGGCPYTDPDPQMHVEQIFSLACRYDVDVDFHADFDLDPLNSILPKIIVETERRGWQGRVSVGHVTKLSAMTPHAVAQVADALARAGVALTVLPATDLFLNGRNASRLVPRGVAPASALAARNVFVTLATNNVLNPFTPFGDCSLMRMGNLFANVAQLSRDAEMQQVFGMITDAPARLLRIPYGITVGAAADIVLIDAASGADAVRVNAPVLAGWKRGRQSFERPKAQFFRA